MCFCIPRKRIIFVLLCLYAVICAEGQCDPPGWVITQITNSDEVSRSPSICGRNVVWQSEVDGLAEVFFLDGASGEIIQISGSDYGNNQPKVSGRNIVWLGGRYNNPYREIYFYDSIKDMVFQVTESPVLYQNGAPEISGRNIIWGSYDFPSRTSSIMFYNGAAGNTLPLFTESYPDDAGSPRISGLEVAWMSSYEGTEDAIFINGAEIVHGTTDITGLCISGGNAAWIGKVDFYVQDYEVFFYDGSEVMRLTDNESDDEYPKICGNKVVWQGWDGHDWEVFLFDGTNTVQLTDNPEDDLYPEVSGNNVVWQWWDKDNWEVMFFDGSVTTRITDNDYDDQFPKVSGSNIVWTGYDLTDPEIFMAVPEVPVIVEMVNPSFFRVAWATLTTHKYRLLESSDMIDWAVVESWVDGTGGVMFRERYVDSGQVFYRVERQRKP